MGLLGGSTTTTTDTKPWQPQADALKSIFNNAGSLYQSKAGTPWYTGDLYAGMDPATAQAIQNTLGYVGGQGTQNSSALTGGGKSLLESGTTGLTGAADKLSQMAGTDPTKANIDAASQYANNPFLQGQIDAASRDVTRNLYENDLPTIDRAATGTGNINSSRAGIAAGVAMRGAQDQIGDIASTMRGNAYNNGLSLAENARTANMSGMGAAGSLYGSAFGQGADAIAGGNSMALGNQDAIKAGQLNQQDRQGQLDANFQKWQGNDQRGMDLLKQYYGIVGSNNWGGSSTSTQKSSGSILGSVLGVGSVLGGMGMKI
jgi:hypothetical protein